MPNQHPDPLYDPKAAGEFLGGEKPIKPSTLAVWRCTKRYDLPYVKLGNLIRYRQSDLVAFLEKRTVR